MAHKTGNEVLELEDRRYAVDLLDGTYGIFSVKKHAEEFIVQQNTVIHIGKRPLKE